MTRVLEHLELICENCKHTGTLRKDLLKKELDEAPTLKNINQLYPEFVCKECKSKAVEVRDDKSNVLIDPKNIKRCSHCALPILIPRQNALKGVSLCELCSEEKELPERHEPWPRPPKEFSSCPVCLKKTGKTIATEIRENTKTGKYFIGCSQYASSRCQWSRNLPEE